MRFTFGLRLDVQYRDIGFVDAASQNTDGSEKSDPPARHSPTVPTRWVFYIVCVVQATAPDRSGAAG